MINLTDEPEQPGGVPEQPTDGSIASMFRDPEIGAVFQDIWTAVERHRETVMRMSDEVRQEVQNAVAESNGLPPGPVPPHMIDRAYLGAVVGLFSGIAAIALPRPPEDARTEEQRREYRIKAAIEHSMLSRFNVLIATILRYRSDVYRDPSQPVAGGGGE